MGIEQILTIPDGVAVRRVMVGAGPLAVLDTGPSGDHDAARAPALLVPGYTGSKEDFVPLLRPLAEAGHRVATYDQRGQHASPGPDDPAAYEVDALAGELLDLVDALGLASDGGLHVVGHSFGGLVARAAVLARPEAFRSLTLLDSGPAAIDGARADRIRALRPVLDEHGLAAVWAAMSRLADAEGAPPVPAEVDAFLRQRFFASSAAGLRAMGEQLLGEPDRVAELLATKVPTLVAYGADDDAWSPDVQADMAARLGASRAVIAGAAHSPNVEAPHRLVDALRRFWRDIDDSRDAPIARSG